MHSKVALPFCVCGEGLHSGAAIKGIALTENPHRLIGDCRNGDQMEHYYQILGLQPEAAEAEVREAYRVLVKVWHPDRFSGDPHLQEKAELSQHDSQGGERLLSGRK